jgi:hypothetical protein
MTSAAVLAGQYLISGAAFLLLSGTVLLTAAFSGALFELARPAALGGALRASSPLDGPLTILEQPGTAVRLWVGLESNAARRLPAAMAEREA